MSQQRFTPIIVGIGDIVNRSRKIEDAQEPAQLMLQAIQKAFEDAESDDTPKMKTMVDSIDVVATWTWPYENLPGFLADKLGIAPKRQYIPTSHGGNQPAKLLDDAARRISLGQSNFAIVCGGEALASLAECAKAAKLPPPGWTLPSRPIDAVFTPTTRELEVGLGKPHRIGAPIHIYPLYENAFRAARGQSIQDNNIESAEMYAEFAKIAEQHKYAWSYGRPAETAETIGTVSPKNRMICFPYPLLMNAFNTVNLAAACILTSSEVARSLGIPETKWIYPLGGAGTQDATSFWERPNYHTSPSITKSLDAALAASNLTKDEIDIYDFYSCFPIVPKIACHHLNLPVTKGTKPISVLGGLTSFGGAGNNYSLHAITEIVRQIRQGKGQTGLVLANGGWLTYQHVLCLSRHPRDVRSPYPESEPLPAYLNEAFPHVTPEAEGPAVVESYTVEYDRNNNPKRGFIIGRLQSNGHRFIANEENPSTLSQLASLTTEPIGRRGTVRKDAQHDGRNLFSFDAEAKL